MSITKKSKPSKDASTATIGFEADTFRNVQHPDPASRDADYVLANLFIFANPKERAVIRQKMVMNDLWQKTPSRPLSGTDLHAA